MDTIHRTSALALALSLPAPGLLAQTGPGYLVSVTRSATALTERDGALEAHGPGYKATLDRDGVTFVPALGSSAPHNELVRFAPLSIDRGTTSLWNGDRTAPRRVDTAAIYDLAPGVTEHWQVRGDGIELQYRFEQPLRGAGDLVVRLAVQTDLPSPAEGTRAPLRFIEPELGGIRIGGVTGIDAAGRTSAGELRYDGSHLELVLGASFVDRAAYPLVLDPLIGPEVAVGSRATDNSHPDTAYDGSNNLYLVSWQEEFSGADVDIRAQLVSPAGSLVGSLMPLASNTNVTVHPTAANVGGSNTFFVAWQEGPTLFGPWNLHGANVAAKPNSGFNSGRIATSTRSQLEPVAANGPANKALLVWREAGGSILGTTVTCGPTAPNGPPAPTAATSTSLGAPTGATGPAISQNGGIAGRHVVVWNAGSLGIQARCVSSAMNTISPVHQVAPARLSEDEPDVDGDGKDFLVVWHQNEPGSPNQRDVFGQKVRYNAGASVLSNVSAQVVVADDAGQDERSPAVGFVGPKTIIAWSQERLPARLFTYDVAMRALDPTNCRSCGPEETLGFIGSAYNHDPQIGTMVAAGSSADEALIVFSSALDRPPFTSDVIGRSYEAVGPGGKVKTVSSACGNGGTAGINGPMALGNASLAYTLTGADPAAQVAVFVLNAAGPPIPCGPCSLTVPLVNVGVPVVNGAATLPGRIGCELAYVGATIETQWWVIGTSTSPCFVPGVSFSSRLHTDVGF